MQFDFVWTKWHNEADADLRKSGGRRCKYVPAVLLRCCFELDLYLFTFGEKEMGDKKKKGTQIYLIWDSLQEFQNSKRIQIVLNNERKGGKYKFSDEMLLKVMQIQVLTQDQHTWEIV